MIAASATSNAPWITYAVLNPLSPMMMGVPSVLAPTVEAIVAVPMAYRANSDASQLYTNQNGR